MVSYLGTTYHTRVQARRTEPRLAARNIYLKAMTEDKELCRVVFEEPLLIPL
jgi:hypothetical protein